MIDPHKVFAIVSEASTALQTSGFVPAAVVMGDADWREMNDAAQRGIFGPLLAASGGPASIHGLPVFVMHSTRGISVVSSLPLSVLRTAGVVVPA